MPAPYRIGCSSWTSDAWWDRFYPRTLKDGERITWYSKYFDTVEVDATYYAVPASAMVRGWAAKTPESFRFTLKLFRDFMDPKKPLDPSLLLKFTQNARLLGDRLGPILLQFPPWVKPGKAQQHLTALLDALDPGLRYAVELRDAGWFRGEVGSWLKAELERRRIALAWSYLTYVEVPDEATTDFAYMRFIGDHATVPAEQHGEIRVDRSAETRRWADRIARQRDRFLEVFVFFNNHYAGFAPESVNEFRTAAGLPRIELPHRSSPRTLDDVGPDRPT